MLYINANNSNFGTSKKLIKKDYDYEVPSSKNSGESFPMKLATEVFTCFNLQYILCWLITVYLSFSFTEPLLPFHVGLTPTLDLLLIRRLIHQNSINRNNKGRKRSMVTIVFVTRGHGKETLFSAETKSWNLRWKSQPSSQKQKPKTYTKKITVCEFNFWTLWVLNRK